MKSRIFDNRRLRRSLQEAYHSRESTDPGDRWGQDVMRRIRQIGSPIPVPFWRSFETVLWRLAPLNVVLIIPLILLILNMDLEPAYDYLVPTPTERIAFTEFLALEEAP